MTNLLTQGDVPIVLTGRGERLPMVRRFPGDVTKCERQVGDCLYDVITAYLKLLRCCSSQESMLVTNGDEEWVVGKYGQLSGQIVIIYRLGFTAMASGESQAWLMPSSWWFLNCLTLRRWRWGRCSSETFDFHLAARRQIPEYRTPQSLMWEPQINNFQLNI
jgi:hypothetical protein